jgi:hypothetical protein
MQRLQSDDYLNQIAPYLILAKELLLRLAFPETEHHTQRRVERQRSTNLLFLSLKQKHQDKQERTTLKLRLYFKPIRVPVR